MRTFSQFLQFMFFNLNLNATNLQMRRSKFKKTPEGRLKTEIFFLLPRKKFRLLFMVTSRIWIAYWIFLSLFWIKLKLNSKKNNHKKKIVMDSKKYKYKVYFWLFFLFLLVRSSKPINQIVSLLRDSDLNLPTITIYTVLN